jgi:hypothetical protein
MHRNHPTPDNERPGRLPAPGTAATACAGRSLRVHVACDAIVATPAEIGNSSVVWRVAPHRDTVPDTLRGILDGYISCYELTLTDIRPSPEGFVSAMPASLRRTRRRREPRARCAATPVARWGPDEEAPVLSVSNGGLAIQVVGGDPPAACDLRSPTEARASGCGLCGAGRNRSSMACLPVIASGRSPPTPRAGAQWSQTNCTRALRLPERRLPTCGACTRSPDTCGCRASSPTSSVPPQKR